MATVKPPRPGTLAFRQYWHLSQDLGPGPNHQIILYRGAEEIAVFNRDRREYSASDDRALRQLCQYLNVIVFAEDWELVTPEDYVEKWNMKS